HREAEARCNSGRAHQEHRACSVSIPNSRGCHAGRLRHAQSHHQRADLHKRHALAHRGDMLARGGQAVGGGGVAVARIESHQELRDDPKVRRFARRLGASIPAAIGHRHLLWWWALDYAMDGDLSKYDAADIADAAQWDGDPDEFLAALMECGVGGGAGFVERTDDGELLLHDWWDYAGKLIQQRTAYSEAGLRGNHERWHVRRGIQDPNCPLCQEQSPSQSGGESGGDRDPNREEIGFESHLNHNHTIPN